jgi:dTDP-4-dehydrorhamnose 3,5-epimerase
MKISKLDIPGLVLLEPFVTRDERGYYFESFRNDTFKRDVENIDFIQDNESRYTRGTLRGLRYQVAPFAQNKLIRVVTGAILDIAVDIRKGSPYYGKYQAVRLDDTYRKKLFIPVGFAHGYLVLSKFAIIESKVDCPYSQEHSRGIAYDDPAIGIDWHFRDAIRVAQRDVNLPRLKDAETFEMYRLSEGSFAAVS